MTYDFTVVIPAYNRQDLIGITLDAVLNQSLRPAEIIIVDDGSTDNTASVAESYPGCKVIRMANAGPPNARHHGVMASSSEWIAFCDSDDIWRPNHLAALADAFQQVPTASYGFTNFVHVVDDEWARSTKFDRAPPEFWRPFSQVSEAVLKADRPIFDEILQYQPIFPSCTAMRRSFYEAVGGYDRRFGRITSEDFEFTLRCVSKAPTVAVREATVGIRKHSNNRSGNQLRQLCGELEILEHTKNRDLPAGWRRSIDEQIRMRTKQAIDAAYTQESWDLVERLGRNVPVRDLLVKRAVKVAIAHARVRH